MTRKIVSGIALGAVLMLFANVPLAIAQEPPKLAGEPSMLNLTHVWNHQTTGTPADGHATDLEFFTSTVPLRDYATGQFILDEEGNEIPVEKDFAVMGTYNGGAWVYDITDPLAPQLVINITCNQQQNDVQLKKFGDRWILALARDGGASPCNTVRNIGSPSGGIAVFDVTDPYEFVRMYNFRTSGGAHNFTFHPTKPFGWVSTGDLPGGLNHIPIIDFTDVDNPKLAADIPVEGGPHDIAFSDDGTRAYVASENNYRIYDATDPAAPTMIGLARPNAGTYAHGFDPTPDKKLAVATNESLVLGGFLAPGSCPGEGLTFFDLSNEEAPVPVGQFFAPVVGNPSNSRACTGHVGQIAPNGNVLVTGWYAGGARVIDFSNPSAPREVGHAVMPNAEVWTANIYKGPYLYTADQRRGFDVFRWTGDTQAPWESTFTPEATEVESLDATVGGSTLSVTGAADFGGEAVKVVGEDFPGDSPGGPETARLGIDALDIGIHRPDPSRNEIEFVIDVTEMSSQPLPEVIRYLWQFKAGEAEYWVQAKSSNFVTAGTTLPDDPEGHATHQPAFQLRGNCTVVQLLNTCVHVAWLDGEFDTANGQVRVRVPLDPAYAPLFREGQVIAPDDGMTASLQVVASNASTSDSVAQESSYTIPSRTVSLQVLPAGGGAAVATGSAAPSADGTFSSDLDLAGVAPGSYVLEATACFSDNCATSSTPFTL